MKSWILVCNEERGEIFLDEYPDVAAWTERLESREGYKAAV